MHLFGDCFSRIISGFTKEIEIVINRSGWPCEGNRFTRQASLSKMILSFVSSCRSVGFAALSVEFSSCSLPARRFYLSVVPPQMPHSFWIKPQETVRKRFSLLRLNLSDITILEVCLQCQSPHSRSFWTLLEYYCLK